MLQAMEPFFSVLLSAIFLGDRPTLAVVAALLPIVGGGLLVLHWSASAPPCSRWNLGRRHSRTSARQAWGVRLSAWAALGVVSTIQMLACVMFWIKSWAQHRS